MVVVGQPTNKSPGFGRNPGVGLSVGRPPIIKINSVTARISTVNVYTMESSSRGAFCQQPVGSEECEKTGMTWTGNGKEIGNILAAILETGKRPN